jgi:hypothetical protein
LVPPIIGTGISTEYYIFIKISKREPPGAPRFIKMFVESAYPDAALYDKPTFGKSVAFRELLGDCWEKRYPKP